MFLGYPWRRYGMAASLAVFCCAALISGSAHAVVSWKRIGTVTTLTNNQMCYTDGTNVICDSNAPTLSSNSVGIGTTTPQNLLDVNGAASIGYNVAAPSNGLIVSGTVGIGTSSPNSNALLDMWSTTQGLLPPRLTTAQETAMGTSLPVGLVVYNTVNNELESWNGASWEAVGAAAAVAAGTTGQVQFNNGAGDLAADSNFFWSAANHRLGIGTSTVANKLDVNGAESIGYINTAAPSNGLIVSGNVGIGTTAPAYPLDVFPSGTSVIARIAPQTWTGGVSTAQLTLGNSSHEIFATAGGYTTIQDANGLLITGGAQVGIGTLSPNANALLDMWSTTKGLLPPRLTTAQEVAMGTSLPVGLVAYNTVNNELESWNGASWEAVGAAAAVAAGTTGQVQFNNGAGDLAADSNFFWDATNHRLGIGTSTVANKLDVNGAESIGYINTAAPSNGLIVSGNVGIGTTNPLTKLHVIGNSGSGFGAPTFSSEVSAVVQNDNVTGAWSALDIVGGQTGRSQLYFGNNTTAINGSIQYDHNANAMLFMTNSNNERMRIDSAGNVGIGTTVPSWPLHIYGNVSGGAETLEIENTNTGVNGDAQVLLSTSSNPNSISVGASVYANRTNAVSSGDTDLLFKNSAGTTMNTNLIIKSTGSVGIGTTSPLSPLSVSGGAALGAYGGGASATAAPANGLSVSGNVGIGTTSTPTGIKEAINGVVQVAGTGSESCTTAQLGAIRYNPTGNYFELCSYP